MKLNVRCHLAHLKIYLYTQVQLNRQFQKYIGIKDTSCLLLMVIISSLKILTKKKAAILAMHQQEL